MTKAGTHFNITKNEKSLLKFPAGSSRFISLGLFYIKASIHRQVINK
jgi:hypothetical protein